jgi:hypothetical protein
MIEARLAGRSAQVTELVDDQILDRLSIGFTITPSADQWSKTTSGVPSVVRQRSELREISLTWRPAYPSAAVAGINQYSTGHGESQRIVAEMRAWMAVDRIRQARANGTPVDVPTVSPDTVGTNAPAPAADLGTRVATLEQQVADHAVRLSALEGEPDSGRPASGNEPGSALPGGASPRSRLRVVS